MPTAAFAIYPKFQAFDANGDPASGYLLHTYAAGTTTNQATYTTPAAGTANANPVVLDSRGEANVCLDASLLYKLVLKTAAGATVWTVDNVGQSAGSMATLVVGATAGTGSVSPVEFIATDCGISLTHTATETNSESYIIGWGKNANSTYFKNGVIAWTVADSSATNGYGCTNIHSGYFSGGVYGDDYILACWGAHGARFFPPDITSASAPGLDILRIDGNLQVVGTVYVNQTGGAVLIGAAGSATAIGANITTVDIRGGSATATGGLKLSSSDSSVVGALYGTGSEIILGSATSHPVVVNYAGTERFRVTSTGVQFAASCRVGFFAATPVVQATNIVDADGTLADITTKFNSLLTKFETYGLLAS